MVEEEDAFENIEGEYDEYVPVVFARDADEAEEYRQLLDDHDIPVIAGDDEGDEDDAHPPRRLLGRGIPILVPEPLLDEASEIIADMDETDEFALTEEDLGEEKDDEEEPGLVDETEPDPEDDLEDDDLFDDDVEEDEDS